MEPMVSDDAVKVIIFINFFVLIVSSLLLQYCLLYRMDDEGVFCFVQTSFTQLQWVSDFITSSYS